ncbi:hypothetical protein L7F22_068322 [Adiantum nelumboides]|nr:hypothetical protein [Adiantum nelumboides]
MPNLSLGGAAYFITLIDNYSRKVRVYFLKHNDEALNVFRTFVTYVENESGKKFNCLRSDNGGDYVSWRSRLQTCVIQSTTEASMACKEAIWLGQLVTNLGIKEETSMLHCDSQSAILLARNPVYHSKTKHVDMKYHFIREMVEDKQVQLVKVHTTDNPADLLTKELPSESFAHCHKLLDVG